MRYVSPLPARVPRIYVGHPTPPQDVRPGDVWSHDGKRYMWNGRVWMEKR